MTIALTMVGMKGPKGDPGQINGMFDISHPKYGATGGSDDTLAFENAVDDASVKGGVVYVPPGLWRAQGLPALSNVRYVGAGWNATTIKLVDGATEPLFKYDTANTCEMAGWSYMTLEGIGASGPDGIDMSAATSWQFSQNIGLRIWKFRRGVYGSQNDRRPYFAFTQFWQNDAGYYVINNHPQIDACDIRDNNYGLTGQILYDLQIDNTIIIRNNYGLVPDVGGSISQSLLNNCSIFGNYFAGAKVNVGVEFDGCFLVAGVNMDASSYGVWFESAESSWKGGAVRCEGVDGWGDCAFIVRGANDVTIDGVTFEQLTNFMRTVDTQTLYRRINVRNCTGKIRGYFAKMNLAGTNGVQGSDISGNTLEIPATGGLLTAGQAVIDIPLAHAIIGNHLKDNTIQCLDAAYAAHAIRADMRASVVTGNIVRNTAGIAQLDSNALTVFKDNVLPSGSQGVILQGSATPGAINLNAGARTSFTITVTNAALGDYAMVSFNSSLLGLTHWNEVSTNTVTVHVENNTAGTINLGSGTWRAMVHKRW